MNANDIMNALSGIDPKYIDEAAYELHDTGIADKKAADVEAAKPGKVTDIASRTRIRKMFYIVLPSVAAILLIVAVALPAVLRVSKSESAAMAESVAPAEYEAAAESPAAENADEAASDGYYPDMASEAEAPAAEEEAAEAPGEPVEEAAETAGPVSESTYSDSANKNAGANQTLSPDHSKDAVAEETEEAAEPVTMWVISDSEYDKGILKLFVAGHVPEDLSDTDCTITALGTDGKEETVKEGRLADVADKIDMTADMVTLDISSAKLTAGSYRITVGNISTDFTIE